MIRKDESKNRRFSLLAAFVYNARGLNLEGGVSREKRNGKRGRKREEESGK